MDLTAISTLGVSDAGCRLDISYEDCVRYHGRTAIGGVALGFKVVERALADLCPGAAPERASIEVLTAFPGPGVRDVFEMVTRAVTRGAYKVDVSAAPAEAPEAVAGRLWFRIKVGDRVGTYQAVPGAMSDEFIEVGRKSPRSEAEERRWTELKEALAVKLMALPATDFLVKI